MGRCWERLLTLVSVVCLQYTYCVACDETCRLTTPNCSQYSETAHPTNSSLAEYLCTECTDELVPLASKYYKKADQIKFLCDKAVIKTCETNAVCKAEFPLCKRVVVRVTADKEANRYFCQKCDDGLFYPGGKLLQSSADMKSLCGRSSRFMGLLLVLVFILVTH